MKKENIATAILFIMAFSTIFLLYAAISADTGKSSNDTPVIPANSDIGKTVYVEGTVLSKRMTYTGDNLILNVECRSGNQNPNQSPNPNQNSSDFDSVVAIFIPRTAGAVSLNKTISVGDEIGVRGVVEEYNGSLEVVLSSEKNLFVLR